MLGLFLVGALSSAGCAARLPVPAHGKAAESASALSAPASVSYHAAVRRLASASFDVRTHATRVLVTGGEAALPALGRAGDMPVAVSGGMRVSATRSVVDTIMGDLAQDRLQDVLKAPWPSVRRSAAEELGRRDRWGAIPDLITSLEDADPEVRAVSASALRRLTNNFFGFRAQAHVPVRKRATQRWRTWWSLEGRAKAAERDGRPQVR